MTDEKKLPDDLGDIDWDQALSEWETKTFVPEVAKDTVTDRPGALAGTATSKPLYRPPVASQAQPQPRPQPPQARPKSPPIPPQPLPPLPNLAPLDEDEGGQTLIAAIPRELLRGQDAGPKSASRGGLGQLFAREERRDASIDVSFDESQPKVPAGRARTEPPEEVVTSAQAVSPLPRDDSDPAPRRRASQIDPGERVPEGAMFDPFAEPAGLPPLDSEDLDEPPSQPTKVLSSEDPPPGDNVVLLAPDTRRYDPEDETIVGGRAAFTRARQAIAAKRTSSAPAPPPADDEATQFKAAVPVGAPHPPAMRTWPDEKPASEWTDEPARSALVARAEWLETEARALGDKIARARGLLACSEIVAIAGDLERARTLAREARELAPTVAIAHRQARTLMPRDSDGWLEALDVEIKMTPAGPARVHSTLLAAEALRAAGDEEAAGKRFEQAARISTADVRAALARAVRALARGDTSSAALRLPDSPDLAPVAEAIATALRLRGVERKEIAPSGEPLPSELLLRARQAVDKGDLVTAAPLVAQLANVPELAPAATWLAASLGAARQARRAETMVWLRDLAARGDQEAQRALIARAVEGNDRDAIAEAIANAGPLTSPERVALGTLAGLSLSPADAHLEATAAAPAMGPLAAAASALATPVDGPNRAAQVRTRAERTAGTDASRSLVRLGRLLAAGASPDDVGAALAAFGDDVPPEARGIALEMAARSGRLLDVSTALEAWGTGRGLADERAAGALAGALIAEHAGNRERALEAFRAARAADPTNEAALRAVASLDSDESRPRSDGAGDEPSDLIAELNALADELGEGPPGAIARLEAVTRGEGTLPDPTRADLLERAHRAAPSIPIAAFLAERIGRRAGDIEEVLRWVRERRASSADPVEAALDAVREALLVADAEPVLASERLLEAHRTRPVDIALRELYERMAPEPPEDSASWREQRASEATGGARALLYLEAAHEYERAGDEEAAVRCAEAAATADASLGRVARERAELRAGRVARLADELLSVAKGADEPRARREAYERLAVLDASARKDPGSALLWHRTILEEQADYLPSLRHVEHHLIGEGRDEELDSISTAIANALRGTGAGECTAHAELSARLRMRGPAGRWEATRELAELAAAEGEPSLWSLRKLQAHARASGDDATFLSTTRRLLDRVSRPAEIASLLVAAAEAATRLGKFDEARELLERAASEDAGDVVVWSLLADVRLHAKDPRGAAEAFEALARSSHVREHQLLAWYEAGRLWQDDGNDEERAILALEAAAAIDVAHKDLFDRLARVYAAHKMQAELASLLERRLAGVTDAAERLALEVRRGRVLLDVGDTEGAREAFESALAAHPDDPRALSAFADLCIAQRDWDAAEQALVRLARLLPTPEEQRDVYARLGDLYARHVRNLSRAEVAFKEVLKRAPEDLETMERLVDVYRRQNDAARAAELQQELVKRARSPEEKRTRLIDIALIHEQTGHDNRRAEQALEAARREFPLDITILRAIAAYYTRHNQGPAVNVLLDRVGADARRAITTGRFAPGLFEVVEGIFELRGKPDAARTVQTMHAALEGRPAELLGASDRAYDPRLDELLAPEVLSPALRALLQKTGDALDLAVPVDLRKLQAVAAPADADLTELANNIGRAIGIGPVQVLVSPKLGAACLPVGSSPAAIVLGEAPAVDERAARFLVLRALKLVRVRASALGRIPPGELAVLVSAWLKCFNPGWTPQGIPPAALNAAGGRLQAVLPRTLDPDVGVIALEVAAGIGTQAAALGPATLAWANRTALLATGDPNAGLDAIAALTGLPTGAPRDPKERATWLSRAAEARDVIAFGVSEAFSEARARLGVTG